MSDNDDLWRSLVEMAAQSKKKPKKSTGPQHKPLQLVPMQRPQWRETEVVLIIHESTCKCCGSVYQWPNHNLLIKKEHPKLGTHFIEMPPVHNDPEVVYSHLPQTTQYHFWESSACQKCFNLSHLIEGARHGR